MLFMVIEQYKGGNAKAVYERFREHGRMMPPGLEYLDSWVDSSFGRCFQLMRCDNEKLLEEWASHWSDLVDFEFIPVMTSKEASEITASR